MESIFDAVAVPVVGLDSDLCVVSANHEARKVFTGINIGDDVAAAISQKRGLRKLLLKTLGDGADTSAMTAVTEGLGREFRTTIRAVNAPNSGLNIALLLTFEDRTQLQDVKSMRSDFVANVSHEIRSPLTAISGFVETLQGPARDDATAREMFLGLMENEVTRMTNLVRDLLSLSRVEVKERRAPKKSADPNQFIRQALESATAFADKYGRRLEIANDVNLPMITGNHDDLVRLLINLLENAVTYSGEGGVVRLSAGLMGDDNPLQKPAIFISVQDEGEGIAADEIPRLTERFYRIDKSRSRNVGGTGLGLAIVKHILVRHRGELEINSIVGKGSDFRIYLPLPPSPE